MNKVQFIFFILPTCVCLWACNSEISNEEPLTKVKTADFLFLRNESSGAEENKSATVSDRERDLVIVVDTSGSANREQILIVLANLCNDLPSFVQKLKIGRLRTVYFGADAWISQNKSIFELPHGIQRTKSAGNYGEFQVLKNISEALKEEDSIEVTKFEKAALQELCDSVAKIQTLLEAEAKTVMNSSKGSRCSDVNGALRRAAWELKSNGSVVVVITDAVENCSPSITEIAKPEGEGFLLVVLVNENPVERGSTTLSKEAGWKQFEVRKKDLQRAIPWTTVLPSYHTRYGQTLLNQMPQ